MDSLPTPGPVANPPTPLDAEQRTMAMLAHLASLSGYIGVPFGSLVGPVLVWLIKKDTMPFVDAHGKEAVNFNLSVMIYALVSAVLILVLIGIPMIIALAIFHVVVTILAAIKAHNGEPYSYPLAIRFIK
jgi:uncharacterized Tic20 family protein